MKKKISVLAAVLLAKPAPDADMCEGLSVHYSGGSSLSDDIQKWLDVNGINK